MKKREKQRSTAQKGRTRTEDSEGFLMRFFSFFAFMFLALAAIADLGALMLHKIMVFKRKTV